MRCPKCGKENPKPSIFCLHCGNRTTIVQKIPVARTQPLRSKHPRTGLIVAPMALAFLIMTAMVSRNNRQFDARSTQPRARLSAFLSTSIPRPTPHWTSATERAIKESFTLGPGQYFISRFTIEDWWRNPRLQGKFAAQGSGQNDIEVFLTDEDGVEDFENHHDFKTWFKSSKVTVETIDIALGPGTYCLVFSNYVAGMAQKAVKADLQLHYEYLKQP